MKTYTLLLSLLVLVGCGEPASVAPESSGSGTGPVTAGDAPASSDAAAASSRQGQGSFTLTSDNTQVLFTGTKKSGDNHSGGFKAVSGGIRLSDGNIANIAVLIETESLFSDDDRLTGHLKNEDFFSVKEFPEMKFESTKVEGEGDVTVTGMLTMHGVTEEISFPASVSVDGESVSMTSEFKVDRTKFGMDYVGKPDDPINAEVDIKIIVGKTE